MLPSVLSLDPPAIRLWFLVAWVTVPVLAGLACLRTAANSAGADRRAWRSFGLGCLLWIDYRKSGWSAISPGLQLADDPT